MKKSLILIFVLCSSCLYSEEFKIKLVDIQSARENAQEEIHIRALKKAPHCAKIRKKEFENMSPYDLSEKERKELDNYYNCFGSLYLKARNELIDEETKEKYAKIGRQKGAEYYRFVRFFEKPSLKSKEIFRYDSTRRHPKTRLKFLDTDIIKLSASYHKKIKQSFIEQKGSNWFKIPIGGDVEKPIWMYLVPKYFKGVKNPLIVNASYLEKKSIIFNFRKIDRLKILGEMQLENIHIRKNTLIATLLEKYGRSYHKGKFPELEKNGTIEVVSKGKNKGYKSFIKINVKDLVDKNGRKNFVFFKFIPKFE